MGDEPIIGGVLKDLKRLSRTWRRARAVLSDGEEAELREASLVCWLQELKQWAYDAEDLLDLCSCEVHQPAAAQTAAAAAKVHDPSAPPPKISASFWFDVSKRAKALQQRFDSILERRGDLRGGDICDSDDEGNEDWLFEIAAPRKPAGSLPPGDEMLFIGREKEVEDLVQLLLRRDDTPGGEGGDDVPVIAVVGMGGIGKTALVRRVFEDPRVEKHFSKRGWCFVSADFDVVRLTREAAEELARNTSSHRLSTLAAIQDKLATGVRDVRFLLVLDDVWNEIAGFWDKFTAPFRDVADGSRFLITTRHHQVVNTMRVVRHYHLLQGLPEDDAWDLFKHHAIVDSEPLHWPDEFKLVIGTEIAEKCDGFPLAIKVLGGMLRHEDDEERWEAVLRSDLCEIKGEEGVEIMGPLRLSYLYMPAHLKPCFAFCALFGKGHHINKERLVRMWMALGLIIQGNKYNEHLEDIGMEYIDDLLSRSFFQHTRPDILADREEEAVMMHDLIHDLAQEISRDECRLASAAGKLMSFSGNVRHASFHETIINIRGPSSLPVLLSTSEDGKSEREGEMSDIKPTVNIQGPSSLRTLLTSEGGSYQEARLLEQSLEYLKRLRVLDFTPSTTAVPASIKDLKLLRYLQMAFPQIKCLPESVCTLSNLQTLDLRHACNIRELPECIGRLRFLRYFDIQGTQIRTMPESTSMLCNLRVLDLSDTIIKELPDSVCKLKNLRRLFLRRSIIMKLPESFCKLYSLQELNLNDSDIVELPRSIGNLKCLRRLYLHKTKIKELPMSFRMLCNLRELDLYETCIEELPDLFADMRHLWYLELRYSRVRILPESIGMLRRLQELMLNNTQVEELPRSVGNLENLKRLDCQSTKIRRLPESICLLYGLKVLDVSNCKELEELPRGIGNLINLEWLGDVQFCKLSYLPLGIGRLSKLTGLAKFPLSDGVDHAGIAELRDLKNLRSSLVITGLHSGLSLEHIRAANLADKLLLRKLELRWSMNSPSEATTAEKEEQEGIAKKEEEILEELRPPATLKVLHVFGYGGIQLPRWLDHPPFNGLHSLVLRNFPRCEILLPFWKMPSLQFLRIEKMPLLKQLDDEFSRPGRFSEFLMLYISKCPCLLSIKVPICGKFQVKRCKNLSSVHFQQPRETVRELQFDHAPNFIFPESQYQSSLPSNYVHVQLIKSGVASSSES